MSCGSRLEQDLSRYVDGELPEEERTRIEEHVAECEACRNVLALFQKNESLLANSLAGGAFKETVVDGVMDSIRRQDPTPVAPPVEEPSRTRTALVLAAAAAFVVITLFVLNSVQSARHDALQRQILEIRDEALRTAEAHQETLATAAERDAAYEQLIRKLRVEAAFKQPGHLIAYLEPRRHIMVKATFDPLEFDHFLVYRRGENEPDSKYQALGDGQPLQYAEFTDETARPGSAYLYKFRAVRSTGEFVESAPIYVPVPVANDGDPARSLRVRCTRIGALKDVAVFEIERIIDGTPLNHVFHVRPGEKLGGVVSIPGHGRVNFGTRLTLEKIEQGHQTMEINYTTPVLDDKGRIVVERLQNGLEVPVTTQHRATLGIRPNLRAIFSAEGGGTREVWKDGWIRVEPGR